MLQFVAFPVPLTGTGTNLLTLHPKVGHKVSFYWDTGVTLVLSFLPVGCSCLFKCLRVEEETREVLWLFVLV